jgi:hypothetical protein
MSDVFNDDHRSAERDKKVEDIELERRKWRNRRRMAWVAVFSMVAETAVLIYVASFTSVDMQRFSTISEPLAWSYFGFLSVVGAYMGFTTWANKTK